jgi:hypothetical protein
MTPILRCTTQLLEEIRRDLSRPHSFAAERVGFLSVRPAATRRSLVLIVEAYHPVADADYLKDPSVGAMMGPDAIRKALDIALLQNVGVFHIHMHEHAGRPDFSRTDLREQDKFVPDFFKVCPTMPHGAVVLSHDLAAGRVWLDPKQVQPITELNFMGSTTKIHVALPKRPPVNGSADFSRQSFLGPHSDQLLANIRALVVGAGGGGSPICQQLAHLGVGNIRVVDPEEIEPSNLNRLVGATAIDVKHKTPKVQIADRHIRDIRPWIDVVPRQKRWQEADDLLIDAHVVFGCVDGYRQRMYLENACRRYSVPYIDIGMDITKLSDQHYAVAGQMIASLPGQPCMKCLGFLTQDRLDREENEYGAAGGVPQVIWTNSTLASLAIGTFVRMFAPWFPYTTNYEWLELDGNSQTVSPSQQPIFNINGPCRHFSVKELGDPFFDVTTVSSHTDV